MTTLLVELEPDGPSKRAPRAAIAGVGLATVLVAGFVTWLALRNQPDRVAYYVPTYLPAGFQRESAWSRDDSFGPQGAASTWTGSVIHYGGEVGDDGRLTRWIDVNTNHWSFTGAEVDVAGTSGEFRRTEHGEMRLRLELGACASTEAHAVGMTASEVFAAMASARCVDGYAVIDAPPGQSELCRSRYTEAAWRESATADESGATVRASIGDCPLAMVTGVVDQEERIETLAGRRTVLQFGDQSGAAFFRDHDTFVSVELWFDEPTAVEAELRRVVEGLERVDATTWHERNGMTREGARLTQG